MKITQAQGNGQGQCALCKKRGKWNVQLKYCRFEPTYEVIEFHKLQAELQAESEV